MTPQTRGLKVASAIFGIVSLLHIVRLFTGPEVYIGSHRLGLYPSLVAIIVTGCLSFWLCKMAGLGSRATEPPAS